MSADVVPLRDPRQELDAMTARYAAELNSIGGPEREALEARHALEKRVSTARARCALLSIALHELKDDRGQPEYICTRWAMTVAFHRIEDLEAWIDRVEGRQA